MAFTNMPAFPQTFRSTTVTISTANTALDGSGTITEAFTANANGALVTHVQFIAYPTCVASAIRLFVWNGTTWNYTDAGAIAAHTVANTTASPITTIIPRTLPDDALKIPANGKLGFTNAVATPLRIYIEWIDY